MVGDAPERLVPGLSFVLARCLLNGGHRGMRQKGEATKETKQHSERNDKMNAMRQKVIMTTDKTSGTDDEYESHSSNPLIGGLAGGVIGGIIGLVAGGVIGALAELGGDCEDVDADDDDAENDDSDVEESGEGGADDSEE